MNNFSFALYTNMAAMKTTYRDYREVKNRVYGKREIRVFVFSNNKTITWMRIVQNNSGLWCQRKTVNVNVIYLMLITRRVLAQSPEPEAHDKVLDNNPDRIGIWKCWILRRGENRSTRRKTSWSKDENQQQTQPTYDAESRNQTRATLVGGKCSTTTPSLLYFA